MPAYLLVNEIEAVHNGTTYHSLPLHCTLVHWFISAHSWRIIDDTVSPVLTSCHQFTITGATREDF